MFPNGLLAKNNMKGGKQDRKSKTVWKKEVVKESEL
jgi:hypothetical protein